MKQQLKDYHPELTDLDVPQKLKDYDFLEGLFDVSVYNKDKKINFIGKCKDRGDSRILKYQDGIPIENYLIQFVPDDHNEVKWKKIIACLDSPVSKKLKNAEYNFNRRKRKPNHSSPEKSCIINFVKNKYPVETVDVILKDKTIIVSTRTLYCEFKEAEHRSNHQYIVIDSVGSRRKCHDEICKGKETYPVIFTNFPEQMKRVVKKYTGGEEATKTLIIEAEKECTKYVKHYFDKEIQPMIYSSDRQLFTALATNQCRISIEECSCKESQIEHQLSGTSYLLTCSICKANVPMPIDCKFTKVINFQDNYKQIVAGGAINEVQEFSCDVSLDPNCGTVN